MRRSIVVLTWMSGLAVGWTLAAFAFIAIASLVGVPGFEGQRVSGTPALLAVGAIGGVLGLVAAVWATRRFGWPTLLAILTAASLLMLAANKAFRLQQLIDV
jgi:hypothetical protein